MEQTTPNNLVNAWIFLNEDEPSGTTYNDPSSCFQYLKNNNIYQAMDIIYLCFVETVPTSSTTIPTGDGTSYTVQIGTSSHGTPPNPVYTNQQYMDWLMTDAKANNPNIKFGITLDYGGQADGMQISNIFCTGNDTLDAANFASNLLQYMQHYGLVGFDVDWESNLCDDTSQAHFKDFFGAIGKVFQAQSSQYYLSISPDQNTNIDYPTANEYLNFVNLQLYSGHTSASSFTKITPALLSYGAKFEAPVSVSNPAAMGVQTGLAAYTDNQENYKYSTLINWRLNSQNFIFEQIQQQVLYGLVNNNYLVETGSGGNWTQAGNWIIGFRDNQNAVALNASSTDGGQTLNGTMTYAGEGPIGFLGTLALAYDDNSNQPININSYQVQNQWGGTSAPWHAGGTWLIGNTSNPNVININILSADGGQTFTGTVTYAGGSPLNFKATRQQPLGASASM